MADGTWSSKTWAHLQSTIHTGTKKATSRCEPAIFEDLLLRESCHVSYGPVGFPTKHSCPTSCPSDSPFIRECVIDPSQKSDTNNCFSSSFITFFKRLTLFPCKALKYRQWRNISSGLVLSFLFYVSRIPSMSSITFPFSRHSTARSALLSENGFCGWIVDSARTTQNLQKYTLM